MGNLPEYHNGHCHACVAHKLCHQDSVGLEGQTWSSPDFLIRKHVRQRLVTIHGCSSGCRCSLTDIWQWLGDSRTPIRHLHEH